MQKRMAVFAIATLMALWQCGMAQTAPQTGRERILMDAGWRFHLGDPGAELGIPVVGWRWKAVEAADFKPAEPKLPDENAEANWPVAAIGEDTFKGRKGFAWYRIILPNLTVPGRTLHFESVDDNATVFLNGVKLLHHEGWNEPFDVPLDANWKPGGPNVLTLLVENTAGAGGVGTGLLQINTGLMTDGPEAEQYNDKDWRAVHLPHDFVVEGTFTPTADAGHGSLPTNVGWYRKTFDIPATDKGRQLWLDFDGVYRNSNVWLNGHLLGNHKSGYTGFRYDITNGVNYGGRNVLAVRADARAQEGWWYEGGGIYRHVWLNKANPVHVLPDSVFVTSQPQGDITNPESANVQVQFQMSGWDSGQGPRRINYQLRAEIRTSDKPDAKAIAFATGSGSEADEETGAVHKLSITLPHPHLWSVEQPALYRAVVNVYEDNYDAPPTGKAGRLLDTVTVQFGIRTIKFDAEKGFFLNGKPVKIQGTCNHQDFAGVGIAMPDSLLEWRIKKLKEMGANAYRMSHNPPAPELLDACDRLGMLVMDENRHLGDTYRDHSPSGTGYSDLSDLKDLIARDRNHPSVIMWSMCNEEGLQGSEEGRTIFAAMKKVVLELDPTRPITCAMNGGWGSGISLVEDLQGCNYNPGGYDSFHNSHPLLPMYGSETASAVSTRGEYVNDATKGYVSAYDVNAPPWAQTAEVAWRAIAERPFVAGGYVWTGFDYKGEPTPYAWPCINSHFGIMDICGFPKDTYYYYQAWWGDKPVVHILPHWNWPGKEGQNIDVWVHSNADRIELFLNGKSLGAKDMPRLGHLEWKIPYAPGKLEAKGYKDVAATPPYAVITMGSGSRVQTRNYKLVASDVVTTTSRATQIRLKPDRKTMTANGEEVIMVSVALLDAKGRVVPYADNEVTFAISGKGSLAGVGNGDPSSHEPDKANKRHAFHGLCLAVIQAGETPGSVELTATAPGLKSAVVRLNTRK